MLTISRRLFFVPLLHDRAASALKSIWGVVSLLSAGLAPIVVVPHLCGATLLALEKKGGGFRPIAVGEVLRRLTSKCVSRLVQSDAFQVLTPLQLGVGVKLGCEAIVHAITSTLENSNIPPDDRWTLLYRLPKCF